jgi:hypothetical protein
MLAFKTLKHGAFAGHLELGWKVTWPAMIRPSLSSP